MSLPAAGYLVSQYRPQFVPQSTFCPTSGKFTGPSTFAEWSHSSAVLSVVVDRAARHAGVPVYTINTRTTAVRCF